MRHTRTSKDDGVCPFVHQLPTCLNHTRRDSKGCRTFRTGVNRLATNITLRQPHHAYDPCLPYA